MPAHRIGARLTMSILRKVYPFNAEQTVNLLSEFGPLITLFVVNYVFGATAGIWALIGTTVLALIVMQIVLKRLPMFALIAGGITLIFSFIALYYNDVMWVQLKVTLFNASFALFLWAGLLLDKNFFKYSFEKSFHYSPEGWRKFTKSFIVLFLFLAALNEAIRIGFWYTDKFTFFGAEFTGFDIWGAAKLFFVMPFTGLYAFVMTRTLQKYAISEAEAKAQEYGANAAEIGVAIGSQRADKTPGIPAK
jgi:intracellular septation protein